MTIAYCVDRNSVGAPFSRYSAKHDNVDVLDKNVVSFEFAFPVVL